MFLSTRSLATRLLAELELFLRIKLRFVLSSLLTAKLFVLRSRKVSLCASSPLVAYEPYMAQGLALRQSFALRFLATRSIAARLALRQSFTLLIFAQV